MFKQKLLKLTVLVCSSMIASVSFASPLTDYSRGKTSLEVIYFPDLQIRDKYTSSLANGIDDSNRKLENFDIGITTGLGRKLAIQYRQFNPVGKFSSSSYVAKFGMRTHEINVLYKIDKNLSVFAGLHQSKFVYEENSSNVTSSTKDTAQVGLIGIKEIAPKTQLFGVVGIGKDISNYEIGVSYEMAKNVDLDLAYRYKKVKKLDNIINGDAYQDDVTAKGLGIGVTYKF